MKICLFVPRDKNSSERQKKKHRMTILRYKEGLILEFMTSKSRSF